MVQTPDFRSHPNTRKSLRGNGGSCRQTHRTISLTVVMAQDATQRDVAAAKRTLTATAFKEHDRACACRKPWALGGLGHCPAHDRRGDQDPSLQISIPARGEIWLCCLLGCRSGVLREAYMDQLVYAESR